MTLYGKFAKCELYKTHMNEWESGSEINGGLGQQYHQNEQ